MPEKAISIIFIWLAVTVCGNNDSEFTGLVALFAMVSTIAIMVN